eukprot:364466-Chlamydomonas_euryale.AAC.14
MLSTIHRTDAAAKKMLLGIFLAVSPSTRAGRSHSCLRVSAYLARSQNDVRAFGSRCRGLKVVYWGVKSSLKSLTERLALVGSLIYKSELQDLSPCKFVCFTEIARRFGSMSALQHLPIALSWLFKFEQNTRNIVAACSTHTQWGAHMARTSSTHPKRRNGCDHHIIAST